MRQPGGQTKAQAEVQARAPFAHIWGAQASYKDKNETRIQRRDHTNAAASCGALWLCSRDRAVLPLLAPL